MSLAIVVASMSSWPRQTVLALAGCSVSVSPSSIVPGSTTSFTFKVTNKDSVNDIQSINILRPSADFTITGYSGSEWYRESTAGDDSEVRLRGFAISPGLSSTFTVTAIAANYEAVAANWGIYISDSPDGSGSVGCNGANSTEISNNLPFVITNMKASDISTDGATISWQTNRPASNRIDYGLSTTYGNSVIPIDDTYVTDHSVKVRSLSTNTTYYYKASSTTEGAQSSSQSGSFKTTKVVLQPSAPVLQPTLPAIVAKPKPLETIPPTVSSATDIKKVFKEAPTVVGVAADNSGIAAIEYSTDAGLNWLRVDGFTAGAKNINFRFTPSHLPDGNYEVIIRATDAFGNKAATNLGVMVIDRLPPSFGNMVITFGPQTIESNGSNVARVAIGTYRVTGKAVGGAIKASLIATDSQGADQSFDLALDRSSGQWSGAIKFTKIGDYKLSIRAVDGAPNTTQRMIGAVSIGATGTVTDSKNRPIKGTTVTLYYMEPSTKRWTVWDGQPYEQANPQLVKNSYYSLMVPAGEYYLKASAPGYGTVVSERFQINRAQSLSQAFSLTNHRLFSIAGHPFAFPTLARVVPVNALGRSTRSSVDKLVGTTVPEFNLASTQGGTVQKIDLYGKPTVITLLETWSPGGVDQLSALAAVQQNPDVGVVPIFEGQSLESAKAYIQLAALNLTGLADPDDTLADKLNAGLGPRHIFIDRSGHIKKVMVGVLSKEQILQILGGI